MKTRYFVHHYFSANLSQMIEADIYVSTRCKPANRPSRKMRVGGKNCNPKYQRFRQVILPKFPGRRPAIRPVWNSLLFDKI
jgi:hypothetical protein